MNPYLLERPALVSFSGGRTSGFMLAKVAEAFGGTLPSDVVPVFANTGLEDERTYQFVAEVSRRFPVVVIERGPKDVANVVTIADCARKGEPFAQLITDKSYLPNPVARLCTAHLKIKAMASYARSLGWERWRVAIGLRADEERRVARVKTTRLDEDYERVTPISDAGHTLKDVTEFWDSQPFDLEFPRGDNLYGNCVGCFLKSRKRLDTIARETPHALAWWIEQERLRGATFRSDRPNYAVLAKSAIEQPLLFSPDDESLPCDCHS